VEDDRQAVDDGQSSKGVFEFVAQLGSFEDQFGLDGVGAVLPVGLDGVDIEFVVPTPGLSMIRLTRLRRSQAGRAAVSRS